MKAHKLQYLFFSVGVVTLDNHRYFAFLNSQKRRKYRPSAPSFFLVVNTRVARILPAGE